MKKLLFFILSFFFGAAFREEIAFVTQAYNAKYLDIRTGRYDNNTVTANLLPLAFGMVPEELEDQIFGNIVDKTERDFGGIRALEPGYRRIRLKPTVIPGLDHVKCAYESVSGRIESSWRLYKGHYEWNVTVPPNTEAEVWIPTKSGYLRQNVGSGSHSFAFWLP